MNILVIDNYDSFTYNLVYYLRNQKNVQVIVKKNDEFKPDDLYNWGINKILISPGPGKPEDSKMSLEVIRNNTNNIPILGVCLGMQAIGIAYAAKVIQSDNPFHGKTSVINHDNKTIFKTLPQRFEAMRYHSLIIDNETMKEELEVTAWCEERFNAQHNKIIMGIRHKKLPLEGVQFHPESILTPSGNKLLSNWLKL